MTRDGAIVLDLVERELLVEALDKGTLVVERRTGDDSTRYDAAKRLEKRLLLQWSSLAGGLSRSHATMRVAFRLTKLGEDVARVTGAS